MALHDCLEWPTVQQEAMSFNELSDVVLDSCRLNKETSILLKMLGKCFIMEISYLIDFCQLESHDSICN